MKSTPSSDSTLGSGPPDPLGVITGPLDTDALDALAALRRALANAHGFTILIAVCNTPVARDNWLRMLENGVPGFEFDQVELNTDDDPLDRIAHDCGLRRPISLTGIEKPSPTPDIFNPFFRGFNLRRPEWRDRVPVPVIFWIPEYMLGMFETQAPDFYNWRSGVFVLPAPDERIHESLAIYSWGSISRGNLSSDAKRRRIEELRARLKELSRAKDHHSLELQAEWLGELADYHRLLGEYGEALRIRRFEELPIYKQLGGESDRAVTLGNIADLLCLLGHSTEALAILREQSLPILEEQGDEFLIAMTYGKIADALHSQRRIEEALSVRRDEQLPRLLKLGDVRSCATTRGKIAFALRELGREDEALRILTEETMPALQALGDLGAIAVTWGSIADLLHDRGQREEAVRIIRDEVLPIYERLGLPDGIAAAYWGIAKYYIDCKEYSYAADACRKAYNMSLRSGRLDAIALIGATHGQLVFRNGDKAEGIAILERSRDAFRQLGRNEDVKKAEELLENMKALVPSAPHLAARSRIRPSWGRRRRR